MVSTQSQRHSMNTLTVELQETRGLQILEASLPKRSVPSCDNYQAITRETKRGWSSVPLGGAHSRW